MDIQLYHFPGACSRVTMTALEETGAPFEPIEVNLALGDQKQAAFRAINPKAKVPALVVDGRLLTETPAILRYLDRRFPEAGLLPRTKSEEAAQVVLADLIWCSSTLHPLVRQIRNPARLSDGDTTALRSKGIEMFTELMAEVDERIGRSGPWWHGEAWSITDVYLCWAYDVAASAGYDLAAHDALSEHRRAVGSRPSFQRARQTEIAAAKRMRLEFPPGYQL